MVKCPKCQAATAPEVLEKCGGICAGCVAQFARDEEIVLSPDQATRIDDTPLPLRPGTRFRNLEVLELVGRGGMGVVYKALQPELDRFVALKVLSPALASDPEFARRFQREAKALAALSHPNIVHIHEYGREGNLYFLTMEFVDGVSLRNLMREGQLTPAQALRIVPQICDALEYAHSEGVIHRDIKPENLLVDTKERVKIADFGLAKLLTLETAPITRTNLVMGTPQYMAPEQHDNLREADHRADIYSLGVVFYEMLTGETPMGRFDPPSKRAKVDARLDRVVLKALDKEPDRRYQSAAHLKTEVESLGPAARATPTPIPRQGLPVGIWVSCAFVVLAMFLPWARIAGVQVNGFHAFSLRTGVEFPHWLLLVPALLIAGMVSLRFWGLWKPRPWLLPTLAAIGSLLAGYFYSTILCTGGARVGIGILTACCALAALNVHFYLELESLSKKYDARAPRLIRFGAVGLLLCFFGLFSAYVATHDPNSFGWPIGFIGRYHGLAPFASTMALLLAAIASGVTLYDVHTRYQRHKIVGCYAALTLVLGASGLILLFATK